VLLIEWPDLGDGYCNVGRRTGIPSSFLPPDLRPNSTGSTLKLTEFLPHRFSMAKRISEWTMDDCLEFVKKSAKVNKEKISEGNVEAVCEAFRSNNIHGSSLSKLNDTDWRQLIPNLGVRIELQAATARKITEEEIAIRTGLFCKSRPAKTVEEATSIRSLPKITSFFKPDADNVLELPDEAVPVDHPDDPVIFEEVSSALTRENLAKFIEYMFWRREQSSHFNSFLLRKAILHYVSLNNNNIKQSARLITSLLVSAGSGELSSDSILQYIKWE
jgi:hypothetical protein